MVCYVKPHLYTQLHPDLNTTPNNCFRENLFGSVVLVFAFRPGVPGSNPAQTLYFCHACVHLFLYYGLCSYEHAFEAPLVRNRIN